MNYEIYIKKSAEKELKAIPAKIHEKMIKYILALGKNPRPKLSKKLHAYEGYRLRIGKYRILYIINDKEKKIEIISVLLRKDAHR
jgi:mRNA interferase RelE/StbE